MHPDAATPERASYRSGPQWRRRWRARARCRRHSRSPVRSAPSGGRECCSGRTGPSFATESSPSAVNATWTVVFSAPCRSAFSTRLRHRMAKASGSMSDMTAVLGSVSAMRSFVLARSRSSTTTRATALRSPLRSIRSRPPSARASCMRRSESRVRRLSVASISAARASVTGSLVSERSRCACAMAPASGVRNS